MSLAQLERLTNKRGFISQNSNEEGVTLRRDVTGNRCFNFFVVTEEKAKNMERFVKAREGDYQHFTDATSA